MCRSKEEGFVLIAMLLLVSTLLVLLAAYFVTSRIELATTRMSRDSATGFATAEAGLNLRAEQVRETFVGYNLPSGSSPTSNTPCVGGDNGSGDFACESFPFGNHEARTYIEEEPDNPLTLTIPPGELYQNLNALEYRYTVSSTSLGVHDDVEAMLELRFKSRLVPLFQFAAFYVNDLEILPGQNMTLGGPVHTNGDLYLNSDATLTINGQVSTGGRLFRGRKNTNVSNGTVRVFNPTIATTLTGGAGRTEKFAADVTIFNNMIQIGVDPVTVPEPEDFSAEQGELYWDSADLRVVFSIGAGGLPNTSNAITAVEIRNSDHTVDTNKTNWVNNTLGNCGGNISGRVVGNTNSFLNNREGATIRMLEVDMLNLLNCIQRNNDLGNYILDSNRLLDDDTHGGIVFFFTVVGPDSAVQNNYGVRVRNGQTLQSNVAGAEVIQGLSIISDQAFYIQGNYNSNNLTWIPAAFMVDSFNVLSNNWFAHADNAAWGSRNPTATTVQAAVISGTDLTGGVNGVGGQGGAYNGGLENYPRFHENWNGLIFTYNGSFVSLGTPLHVDGLWVYGNPQYTAPTRTWTYDTRFNNAENLPPITPRFVYLRQELFVRDFEQ